MNIHVAGYKRRCIIDKEYIGKIDECAWGIRLGLTFRGLLPDISDKHPNFGDFSSLTPPPFPAPKCGGIGAQASPMFTPR